MYPRSRRESRERYIRSGSANRVPITRPIFTWTRITSNGVRVMIRNSSATAWDICDLVLFRRKSQTYACRTRIVPISPATKAMKTFWRWRWAAPSAAPTVSRPDCTARAVSSSSAELILERSWQTREHQSLSLAPSTVLLASLPTEEKRTIGGRTLVSDTWTSRRRVATTPATPTRRANTPTRLPALTPTPTLTTRTRRRPTPRQPRPVPVPTAPTPTPPTRTPPPTATPLSTALPTVTLPRRRPTRMPTPRRWRTSVD